MISDDNSSIPSLTSRGQIDAIDLIGLLTVFIGLGKLERPQIGLGSLQATLCEASINWTGHIIRHTSELSWVA